MRHDSAISVIAVTLNWNGASDTVACVRALLLSESALQQIVVCDNASRQESWEELQSLAELVGEGRFSSFDSLEKALAAPMRPFLVLIQTGANLGYAGGMNVGLRYALADAGMSYCWILNNDTEVHPSALGYLLARVATDIDSKIGVCGATLLLYNERDRVQALGGASYQPWRARSAALGIGLHIDQIPDDPSYIEARMAYVNGAAMLVSREFLENVGLMEEGYFLYSEEHDWAYRGSLAGFRLAWAPRARVFHKHGATIGTASSGGSTLSLFYLYRSKLIFVFRNQWIFAPIACFSLCIEAIKFYLKGHPSKAFAAFRGLMAAFIKNPKPPVNRK